MKRFGLSWAAMCLVAALATGCGGSGGSGGASSTAASTAPAAAAATITITDMNYGQPVKVPPGAKIAIKNTDSVEHSVTSDTAGKFTVDVDGNEEGSLTAPTEPGDYAFHCKYHPSMHGTLTVT
jgi:plastocyanin